MKKSLPKWFLIFIVLCSHFLLSDHIYGVRQWQTASATVDSLRKKLSQSRQLVEGKNLHSKSGMMHKTLLPPYAHTICILLSKPSTVCQVSSGEWKNLSLTRSYKIQCLLFIALLSDGKQIRGHHFDPLVR